MFVLEMQLKLRLWVNVSMVEQEARHKAFGYCCHIMRDLKIEPNKRTVKAPLFEWE